APLGALEPASAQRSRHRRVPRFVETAGCQSAEIGEGAPGAMYCEKGSASAMTDRHVDADELEKFQRGTLPADGFVFVGRHVAVCEECAQRFRTAPALQTLRDAF